MQGNRNSAAVWFRMFLKYLCIVISNNRLICVFASSSIVKP